MAKKMSADAPGSVTEAVMVLKSGGVACLPTDTVYGLAAIAENEAAVARVFNIKGRSWKKPLPIFLADISWLTRVCQDVPVLAYALAEKFWPGALTMVLPKASTFDSVALAGSDKVAVRMPGHELVLSILSDIGKPLTGTSANISGQPSPASFEEAFRQIGPFTDLLIDGGACSGVESTILDLTGKAPSIIRAGAIARGVLDRSLAHGTAS